MSKNNQGFKQMLTDSEPENPEVYGQQVYTVEGDNSINQSIHYDDNYDDEVNLENDLNKFSCVRLRRTLCDSMKKNLVPGIILNCIAFFLLVTYYSLPFMEKFLNQLGELKKEYGIIYSSISTSLFGGIIPVIFIIFTGSPKNRTARWLLVRVPFFALFWAARGVELDMFFRFQSYLFGDESKWDTILYKTLFDEFIFAPFWSTIYVSFVSTLEMNDFAVKETFASTIGARAWWINKWIVLNCAAWCVWIPICVVIYSLPPALQTTLLNIVVVFWVLLLRLISAAEEPKTEGLLDIEVDDVHTNLLHNDSLDHQVVNL